MLKAKSFNELKRILNSKDGQFQLMVGYLSSPEKSTPNSVRSNQMPSIK